MQLFTIDQGIIFMFERTGERMGIDEVLEEARKLFDTYGEYDTDSALSHIRSNTLGRIDGKQPNLSTWTTRATGSTWPCRWS